MWIIALIVTIFIALCTWTSYEAAAVDMSPLGTYTGDAEGAESRCEAAKAVAQTLVEKSQAFYDKQVAREGTRATKSYRRAVNRAKRRLIHRMVSKGDVVLDVGAGRGGDLRKYADTEIAKLVHSDVSEESVEEARRRAREINMKIPVEWVVHDSYGCTKAPLWTPPADGAPATIAFSMFSLHYAFYSRDAVEIFFDNLARSLAPGARFAFIVVDEAQVRNRRHRLFRVEILNEAGADAETPTTYIFEVFGQLWSAEWVVPRAWLASIDGWKIEEEFPLRDLVDEEALRSRDSAELIDMYKVYTMRRCAN